VRSRVIRRRADIEEGLVCLRRQEPRFAALADILPPPPLRRSSPGFETLLRTIVSQQLSVAAASSIWNRLGERGLRNADRVVRARSTSFAACGLSAPKIRYAKTLAKMVQDGSLPLARLSRLGDEEVAEALVAVPGIGLWTAEIYVMFALGRADAFAAGDLALQEATRDLFDLDRRPTDPQLRELAEVWRPWRSVAARVLWQYYRHAKGREGMVSK